MKKKKVESLKDFLARRDPKGFLQMCRIRSDLWKKESPPILEGDRKDGERYLEPAKNPWLIMGDTTLWEDKEGIVRDGKEESAFNFCFYLPDGEMVWGMSIDFDFEERRMTPSVKKLYGIQDTKGVPQ